jgi:hypothetical protein
MKIYIIKKLILYMRNKEHIIIILGVILILIGFISFVIWLFIFYEENNSDYVDLKFVVDDSSWDDMNKLSELTVERGYDDANITGFNLIFDFEKGSVKHFVEELIDKGEKKVIKLNFSNFEEGNLVSIKIVPVFDGKEGRVTDEMLFEVIPKNNLGWNTDFDIPVNRIDNVEKTCIPTKTCGDYACGSRLFDGCRNILNCDCPTGKTCVDNMCVVCNVTKTCQDYNNEGRCGSELFDGCRNILNCDCPTGKTCANGMCVNVTEKCSLKTCINYSGQCGNLDDGCGGTINCGCESGECVGGICILPPSGTTYYIDAVSGSDTNTGQSSSPWKTMSKVKSSAQANSDIIILNWNDALVSEKWPTNQKFKSNKVYQYGIQWSFNKVERIGRFANGDFWTVGPVTITRVSPDFTGTTHGWEIDPQNVNLHPYDSRIDFGTKFSPSLVPTLPYIINPASNNVNAISAIKVIGRDPAEAVEDRCGTEKSGRDRGCIRTASVLTVVSEVPINNGATLFRPPYVYTGGNKVFYSAGNLRIDLLPKLKKPSNYDHFNLDWVVERFNRVRLDHLPAVGSQRLHPRDYMWGHQEGNVVEIGTGALILCLDYTNDEKRDAVIAYTQMGIDYYWMIENGRSWSSNGAHGSGRKLPILFAGLMLNNNGMLGTGKKYVASEGNHIFAEDRQTFYTNENPPFVSAPNPDCYSKLDAKYKTSQGYARFGQGYWFSPDVPRRSGENKACDGSDAPYWVDNYRSWPGQTLAAHLLGLVDEWNHKAYFDVMDRKIEMLGHATSPPSSSGSGFNNKMWDMYR